MDSEKNNDEENNDLEINLNNGKIESIILPITEFKVSVGDRYDFDVDVGMELNENEHVIVTRIYGTHEGDISMYRINVDYSEQENKDFVIHASMFNQAVIDGNVNRVNKQ